MSICGSCSKAASPELSLKQCSGCRSVAYCSTACQLVDWKGGHKACCKEIQAREEVYATSASGESNDDGVDPRVLEHWKFQGMPGDALGEVKKITGEAASILPRSTVHGLQGIFDDLVSKSRTEDLGALHAAFEGCVPPVVKMALLQNGENGAEGVSLSPSAQWLYTLLHITHYLTIPSTSHRRFLLSERGTSLTKEMLVIDVKDVILRCPDSVRHGPNVDHESKSTFATGAQVKICGLLTRPEMNGKIAIVTAFDEAGSRYAVSLEDESSFKLKASNLREYSKLSKFQEDAPLLVVRFMHL